MEYIPIFIKFVIGLFALINPIGMLPVFITLTNNMTNEARIQTNRTACMAVAIILTTSLIAGKTILDTFGISLSSFSIAGGLLVVIIGMTMINGKLGVDKNSNEVQESAAKNSVAIVPLALPILSGPGAMTSVIVWGANNPGLISTIVLTTGILLFASICWLIFRSASIITRVLGKTGLNVVTRIMGLLLMAMGVEIMVNGILAAFPGLAG